MKVIFVAGSGRMGGTERNVLRLAGALLEHGVAVEVVLLSEDGPLTEAYHARRIPVFHAAWSYRARAFSVDLARLAEVFRSRKPAIVHAYGYPAIWWGILAAVDARMGARVIAIQAWDTWKRWSERLLDRVQAPAVHLAIADGEGARRFAAVQQRLPPERTRTVYDGVAADDLQPTRSREATRADLGIMGRGTAIGVVARLDDVHKGQSVLLRAAPTVLAAVPEAIFVLIGDGADRARLEGQAKASGISDRVRFAGTRTDLGDVLAALDLLVIPSRQFESVPKILVEGMATGRVIVASRVGDIPELLEDGRTGWLVPPGEPGPLAARIVECLTDQARAAALASAARAAIDQRGLSLETTVARLYGLYTDLMREAPFPPIAAGVRRRIRAAASLYLTGQALRARRRKLAGLTREDR